jgi:hypothetical protein
VVLRKLGICEDGKRLTAQKRKEAAGWEKKKTEGPAKLFPLPTTTTMLNY